MSDLIEFGDAQIPKKEAEVLQALEKQCDIKLHALKEQSFSGDDFDFYLTMGFSVANNHVRVINIYNREIKTLPKSSLYSSS